MRIDQLDAQDHPSRRQPLLLESRPWEEGDLAEKPPFTSSSIVGRFRKCFFFSSQKITKSWLVLVLYL